MNFKSWTQQSDPPTRPLSLPNGEDLNRQREMQEEHLAIACRAYELFEARGCEHGHDWEDWFRAESELYLYEWNGDLTPTIGERIRELFELINDEKDPEKVQVLSGELGRLLIVQAPLRKPNERQLRIIELVARGLKNREIAERLGISDKVVKNYLSNIYDKIGVNNRVQLALWFEVQVHQGKIRRSS